MEPIREEIVRLLRQEPSESDLIARLTALVAAHGAGACRAIFHVLTSLELEDEEACQCWEEVLRHLETLNRAMGRPVSLRTAICDYFTAIHRALKNPKVVELHIYEKTVRESNHDFLTGLFNRHYLEEALAREVAIARRHDTDVSLLFLDIDDFKAINDQYGHAVGDRALRHLAALIVAQKRAGDIAARYGGEEIVLIFPYTSGPEAMVVAERIRRTVAASPVHHGELEIPLTVSGGLVSFPQDAKEPDELLQYADQAMYQAKGAGKNTIVSFRRDRRRYRRLDFQQPATVRRLHAHTVPSSAHTANLGLGGVLLVSLEPHPPGTRLELRLETETEPIYVIGTVVRQEQRPDGSYQIGLAVGFQEMDRLFKQRVAGFFARDESTKTGRSPKDRAEPPASTGPS